MSDDSIQITLRDVYDLVLAQGSTTADKLTTLDSDMAAHLASDVNSFAEIRIKLYGVAAGILTLIAAIIPLAIHSI